MKLSSWRQETAVPEGEGCPPLAEGGWRLGDTVRLTRACSLLDNKAYALLGLYYPLIPASAVLDGTGWLLLVRVFTGPNTSSPIPAQAPSTRGYPPGLAA